jgi:hypothetical protein
VLSHGSKYDFAGRNCQAGGECFLIFVQVPGFGWLLPFGAIGDDWGAVSDPPDHELVVAGELSELHSETYDCVSSESLAVLRGDHQRPKLGRQKEWERSHIRERNDMLREEINHLLINRDDLAVLFLGESNVQTVIYAESDVRRKLHGPIQQIPVRK